MATLLLFAGCGGQSYVYQDATEAKPGPGLFSGDDGEFNLITSQQSAENEKNQEELSVSKEKKE